MRTPSQILRRRVRLQRRSPSACVLRGGSETTETTEEDLSELMMNHTRIIDALESYRPPHPLLTRPQRSRSVTARDMPSSPTMGGSDLPRTMARIRRLVRENPNDRELQRLLHSMLTSMTTDKIDEAEVHGVLTRMEQRKDRTAGTTPQGGPSSPPLAMARSHLVSPAPKSPGTAPTWSAALGGEAVEEVALLLGG